MAAENESLKKAADMAEALSEVGMKAYVNFYLHQQVSNAFAARSELEIYNQAFWTWNLDAYLTLGTLELAKFWDDDTRAVSLKTLFCACEHVVSQLPKTSEKEAKKALRTHRHHKGQLKRAFQAWIDFRHQKIAHTQFAMNAEEASFLGEELILSDVRDLLKELYKIVEFWRTATGLGHNPIGWLPWGAEAMAMHTIRALETSYDYELELRNGRGNPHHDLSWAERGKLAKPPEGVTLREDLWERFVEPERQLKKRTKEFYKERKKPKFF